MAGWCQWFQWGPLWLLRATPATHFSSSEKKRRYVERPIDLGNLFSTGLPSKWKFLFMSVQTKIKRWRLLVLAVLLEMSNNKLWRRFKIIPWNRGFVKRPRDMPEGKSNGISITGHEDPRRMWMQRSTYTQPRHKEEVGWLVLRSAFLLSGKSPSTHFIGGWVDHRASLITKERRKPPSVRHPG